MTGRSSTCTSSSLQHELLVGPWCFDQHLVVFNPSPNSNSHAAVEVHSVDTNCWIILDSQINVLGDTESKIASVRKVLLAQFILLDFQTSLEDLLCFRAADCDMDCDLFVSTDTKGSDGIAGFACRRTNMLAYYPQHNSTRAYCRRASGQTTVPTPSQHESTCHQTLRPRCSGRVCRCAIPAWGWSSCRCRPPSLAA